MTLPMAKLLHDIYPKILISEIDRYVKQNS